MWMQDVAATLKTRLGARGAKVPTLLLPDFVVRLLAPFIAQLRLLKPMLGRRHRFSFEKARRVLGYAPRQVELYAARLGLTEVHPASRLRHGVNPRRVEYVVISQDVLSHAEGRQLNQALLRLVEDASQFQALGTVRSAGFPLDRCPSG